MQARAGIIGGAIGAIIKLIIDQLTFAAGISSVDTIGDFSQFLFGFKQMNLAICIVYIIVAGVEGWLISSLIFDFKKSLYVIFGIAAGIISWALMNTVLIASAAVPPTWSMGVGGFITDLITHIIFGLSVAFAVQICKKRVQQS